MSNLQLAYSKPDNKYYGDHAAHLSEKLVAGDQYITDRVGDYDNVRYGSIERSKIPKYRMAGHGRLLGLDKRYRIKAASDAKRDVEDESLDSIAPVGRFQPRKNVSTYDHSPLVVKVTSGEILEFIDQDDFVPLNSKRRRKRRKLPKTDVKCQTAMSNSESSSDSQDDCSSNSGEDQRDKPGQPSDFEVFRNHRDNIKHVELVERTSSDPQDINAWINLIEHQESYFRLTNAKNNSTSSERWAVSNMRISYYKKALSRIVDAGDREVLHLGLMSEGQRVWDTDKQMEEWKSIVGNSHSVRLWLRYLDFVQTTAVSFTYERTLAAFNDALQEVHSITSSATKDLLLAYWLLRLTAFMNQAGFSERAIAIWQSALEYNHLRPLNLPESDAENAFQQFWDSECPRIGEPGAVGWLHEYDQDIPSRTDLPLPTFDRRSLFEGFGNTETERGRLEVMPARTLDDTTEDDPYRIVIFSDVHDFLIGNSTPRGQWYLLSAFLKFCGLPPLLSAEHSTRMWWTQALLSDHILEASIGTDVDSGVQHCVLNCLMDSKTLFPTSPWRAPWPASDDSLTALAKQALLLLVTTKLSDDLLAEYTLALMFHLDRKAARKHAKAFLKQRSTSLMLYNAYAMMEACSGKLEAAESVWSTALSMVPSLSQQDKQSRFNLWSCWIWEYLQRQQWDRALCLIMSLPEDAPRTNDVLSEITTGHRLKVESFYRHITADAIASGDSYFISICTELTAITAYLLSERDLDVATATYSHTLEALGASANETTAELLHQHQARLIHLHSSTSRQGYRPAKIVKLLKISHVRFPENSIFATLLDHHSRRAGIIDRLRTTDPSLSSHVEIAEKTSKERSNGDLRWPHSRKAVDDKEDSIMPYLLRIERELSRPEFVRSIHAIRAAFRHATSASNSTTHESGSGSAGSSNRNHKNDNMIIAHSPTIWMSQLKWELSLLHSDPPCPPTTQTQIQTRLTEGTHTAPHCPAPSTPPPPDKDKLKAKDAKRLRELWFAALRACPWYKPLYLLGFRSSLIRDAVGSDALAEVYQSMLDRGLRVRVDISDLLASEGGADEGGGGAGQ